MTTETLLALKLGTREIGCAVFIGDALTDQTVKSLRRRAPEPDRLQVLHRAISGFIEIHRPGAIAIEALPTHDSPVRDLLTRVYHVVCNVTQRHDVPTYTFAPATIRKTVTGDATATKRIVARSVVDRYPHLRKYLNPKEEWRERYVFKLFDAVACGLTYRAIARTNDLSSYAI